MAWKDVRAAVRDLLAGVEITEPQSLAIRHVFEFPPAAIEPGDVPCFVMMPPARNQDWAPNYWRTRTYEMRIMCLVRDEQSGPAANIVDAFAEAAMGVLIPAIKLGEVDTSVTIVTGPNIDEPGSVQYGARAFVGFDMHITLRFEEAVAFAT